MRLASIAAYVRSQIGNTRDRVSRRIFFGLSNLIPRTESLDPVLFRSLKTKALDAMPPETRKVFEWSLVENDERTETFQRWAGAETFRNWLGVHRPHHFRWRSPSDRRLSELRSQLLKTGASTWRSVLQRPFPGALRGHDLYSLPDIYYITEALGHVPSVALDIGAGWGRMAMAWRSAGCRSVAIVDSIEQQYLLQNLYIRGIPGTPVFEELNAGSESIDLRKRVGVTHLPLWQTSRLVDRSVEAISAVQVLREVSAEFVLYVIAEIKRLLQPGGVFYIRDNDPTYTQGCMHTIDIHEMLLSNGFTLRLAPDLRQAIDIHGLPRVYARQD